MEDDRPVVSFWAGRYFVNAVSGGEPSGCPGWHLLAGMRLAGARHRQKIRDSGTGRDVFRRRAHGDTAAARQLRSSATETWILGIGTVVGKDPAYEKSFRFSSEAFDLSGCGGRI